MEFDVMHQFMREAVIAKKAADMAVNTPVGIDEAVREAIREVDAIGQAGRLGIVYRELFPNGLM